MGDASRPRDRLLVDRARRPLVALRRPAHEGERRRGRGRRRARGWFRRAPRAAWALSFRARPPVARPGRHDPVVRAPRPRPAHRGPSSRTSAGEVHGDGRSCGGRPLAGESRRARPPRQRRSERLRRRLRPRPQRRARARARPRPLEGATALNVWLVAATVLLAAVAVAVEGGVGSPAAAPALVVAVFRFFGNPAVTIATARAARARRER